MIVPWTAPSSHEPRYTTTIARTVRPKPARSPVLMNPSMASCIKIGASKLSSELTKTKTNTSAKAAR